MEHCCFLIKRRKSLNINNLYCHGLFLFFIFKDEAANKITLSQRHSHDWCMSCNHPGYITTFSRACHYSVAYRTLHWVPHFWLAHVITLLNGITCPTSRLLQLFFNHHMDTHTHYNVPLTMPWTPLCSPTSLYLEPSPCLHCLSISLKALPIFQVLIQALFFLDTFPVYSSSQIFLYIWPPTAF